jgi:NAD-dependent dihydropyrimidine dehydrogenase PreA subunit
MAVLGIIGTKIKNTLKYPSFHLESEKENCSKCRKCTKARPMSLNVSEMVQEDSMNHNDCILCGSCLETCPKSTIKFAWKWKK